MNLNECPLGSKKATLHRVMNNILRELNNEIYFSKLGDILIFSKSFHESEERMKKVFDGCRKSNLTIQLIIQNSYRKTLTIWHI